MGSGASTSSLSSISSTSSTSSQRLRKLLLLRAYNCKKSPDQSLREQFLPFCNPKTPRKSEDLISIGSIRKCLQLGETDFPWIGDLLSQFHVGDNSEGEILFSTFINFLETGTIIEGESNSCLSLSSNPTPPTGTNSSSFPPKISSVEPSSHSSLNSLPSPTYKITKINDEITTSSSPSTLPSSTITTQVTPNSPSIYNKEEEVINIDLNNINKNNNDRVKLGSLSSYLIPSQREQSSLEVIIKPSTKSTSTSVSTTSTTGPVWKKVERVTTERVVEYSTIDANGERQDLIEREVEQKEAFHIENRLTGTFAHREATKLEREEVFNGQVVQEVNGNEEYVHFKSPDDEYHYMESTMPQKEDPRGPTGNEELEEERRRREEEMIEEERQRKLNEEFIEGREEINYDGNQFLEPSITTYANEEYPISPLRDNECVELEEEGEVRDEIEEGGRNEEEINMGNEKEKKLQEGSDSLHEID